MITDLFSHKIHASGEEWPEKLIELAFIFSKFDGLPYNRDQIEAALLALSTRSSYAARDASKFRDEFSAYQSYLGLYHFELRNDIWCLILSETAKKFLVCEEPDVTSFLILQLSLFQYPNGMGGIYYGNSNNIKIQANARDRTLDFIQQNIHLSPLRLIVTILAADADLREVPLLDSIISISEVFAIANDTSINDQALPSLQKVKISLEKVRNRDIYPPVRYEPRFHILEHLDLFQINKNQISIRQGQDEPDRTRLSTKLSAILKITNQFNGFDNAINEEDLQIIAKQGDWGKYFDGVVTIPHDIITSLTTQVWSSSLDVGSQQIDINPLPLPEIYPLKTRNQILTPSAKRNKQYDLADPELTRIKRQRRNLAHKLLLEKIDKHVRDLGGTPLENDHIDLYAKIPNDGGFLFEVKSGGENLLDQIRKGLSQLYEYQFRYKALLHAELHLCLVLPSNPQLLIPWIIEYLCIDRGICVCWFDESNRLIYPPECADVIQYLLPNSPE